MTLATDNHPENPMHLWHDVHARQRKSKKCQPTPRAKSTSKARTAPPPTLTTRVFTVSNTSDSGEGSLRSAILGANSSSGSRNSIVFAIESGNQKIRLQFALPAITGEVFLDATSQPGFEGSPLIEIDGRDVSQAYGATIGLRLFASNSTIKGLRIDHFTYGVKVQSAHGNTIEGNMIGARSFNGCASIFTGIVVQGGDGHFICGNAVVDPQWDGISLENSEDNLIGGPFSWDSNIVTGAQEGSGITFYHQSTNNVVQRNHLYGNATGILIDPSSRLNVVSGNQISRSTLAGIEVQGSDNYVGAKGDFNTIDGVDCGSGIVVENQRNSVAGNLVSGACYSGILLSNGAANTSVLNNIIFQNKGTGVDVEGTDSNQIGDYSRGNTIYDNGSYGICMRYGSNYNRICGNSIYSNAAAGIHLASGANDSQAAPSLTAAIAGSAGCCVVGTVRGPASSTVALDIFASRPKMLNQGETALGTFSVATNEDGCGHFVITIPVAEGHVITATSTNTVTGETSSYSNSLAATTPDPVAELAGDPADA